MVQHCNPKTTFGGLTRRDFIQLSTLAAAGLLTGCAANPVTGRKQLMLVSEDDEIQIDKKNSPYQFSADYGTVRDPQLAAYMERHGRAVATLNINTLEGNPFGDRRGTGADYSQESAESRAARRLSMWTPARLVLRGASG